MREKTVEDHEGKKHPAETARSGGAAYAPHDEGAEKLAESTGDNRTPDKTIGEIKYAKNSEKEQRKELTGGAGEPQSSALGTGEARWHRRSMTVLDVRQSAMLLLRLGAADAFLSVPAEHARRRAVRYLPTFQDGFPKKYGPSHARARAHIYSLVLTR